MENYYKIKNQRKNITAPVDYMGCHCVDASDEETKRFQILVSLLLSSQTKDQVTHEAIANLNRELGVLSRQTVRAATSEAINSCIGKVGYHNKKTKFLKELSLREEPQTLEDLLKLPGIGKKMAFLYLEHALGHTAGIAVDTHVHRISNRIGLACSKNPEETRKALERIFPISEWAEINKVLVGFGQVICQPLRPLCSKCDISDSCPYSQR